MSKFWVVIRDVSKKHKRYHQNIITEMHVTQEDARNEAERLALQERDNFFVMESIAVVGPRDVEWTEIDDED